MINLINVYNPYTDRHIFWENLVDRCLLDLENLIIVGDMHLTISVGEA
jgi:hypothetical protein